MTVSSATAANLGTLIAEKSPAYFARGINNKSPLLKSGSLKKEKVDGEEYVLTLFPGSNHATGFGLDGGDLPVGGASLPVKARVMPRVLMSTIKQGRSAAKLRLSIGAIAKMLDTEMKERAADCGRQLNRAIIGGAISPQAGATWSGTAANSTVTVPFLDVSMFRVGAAYDFLDATASKSYVVRCTAVAAAALGANSANVAGNVSFINDVPSPSTGAAVALTDTTVATGDSFRPRGYAAGFGGALTSQAATINSFDDIAGASTYNASFMGVDPAVSTDVNWVGNYVNHNAAYSQEALTAFAARIATYGDTPPDVFLCHPQLAAAHRASSDYHGAVFGVSASISAGHVRTIERTTDKYGNVYEDDGLRAAGMKVVQDPNCTATRGILFASEWTKLLEWAEMGPDSEAGDPVLLGRSYYTNEVQMSGIYNLATDKRISVGIFDGVTGL